MDYEKIDDLNLLKEFGRLYHLTHYDLALLTREACQNYDRVLGDLQSRLKHSSKEPNVNELKQDKQFDNIFKDEIKTIFDDKREIESLQLPDGEMIGVGNRGITKIVAYCEPGEYCGVPWFAVYTNDEILSRVNAKCVESVIYISGKEPERSIK